MVISAMVASACASSTTELERATHRTVTLFHSADIHSHLFPRRLAIGERDAELGLGREGQTPLVGGVARIGGLLDRERGRAEASFFVDSGDVLEGSVVFSAFHGVPEVLASERLGLDAQAVGNHDLTHGPAALAELRTGRATFPLLAANLEELVSTGVALASVVVEREGVRVGVVGLGRSPDSPVDLDESAAVVERAIAGFASPVDAVVVLSHLGRDADLSLVPRTSGVDVVFGGHTHDVLEPPKVVPDCGAALRARARCRPRPVMVVHSGAYGRYVGRVDLTVSSDPVDIVPIRTGKRSAVVDSRYTLLPVNEAVPERADLVDLLAPYHDALVEAGLERPIAFAPAPISRSKPARGDSALGNFVTHAMRVAADADLAVINSTGVRADLPKGELSVDDFFEVLPFEDELVTLNVTGDDLMRAFREVARDSCDRARTSQVEVDNARVVLGCAGAGTADVAIGRQAIDPARAYRVAAASFVVERGQWLHDRGVVVGRGPSVHDVVIGAAQSGRPCATAGPSSRLPCVDGTSGAVIDGRISWR